MMGDSMSSVEWHKLYNKERVRANDAEEEIKSLREVVEKARELVLKSESMLSVGDCVNIGILELRYSLAKVEGGEDGNNADKT